MTKTIIFCSVLIKQRVKNAYKAAVSENCEIENSHFKTFYKFAIFKHCEQNNFKVQYTNVIEVFI